jgi:hypothetical protein
VQGFEDAPQARPYAGLSFAPPGISLLSKARWLADFGPQMGIKYSSRVRFWHLADIDADAEHVRS